MMGSSTTKCHRFLQSPCVIINSPSFLFLHLCHSSLYNPSLALSMSQLIFQPFRCFTYVTAHSLTLLSLLLSHRIFTYITWRAAHDIKYCSTIVNFFHYARASQCYRPGSSWKYGHSYRLPFLILKTYYA